MRIPERSPSRAGFVNRNEYMEPDTSLSSIASSESGSLPTIPEKPYGNLSPPPKRKPTEELDDIWFKSHLAEVLELEILEKGCPYFWKARVRRWPQAVVRDMTDYVNCEEAEAQHKL